MNLVDRVIELVLSVPPSRVTTYGDIGAVVGVGARQVGGIMSLLSDDIPWWRVVHADGTPPSCHAGTASQLLLAEGTPMRGKRVNMTTARTRLRQNTRP